MEISHLKFISIINQGFNLNEVYILQNPSIISEMLETPKTASLVQGMVRKQLLDSHYTLTDVGYSILENLGDNKGNILIKKVAKMTSGMENIHELLEDKIRELTGKKQVRVDIMGTKYSFLCNKQDLEARLKKVMAKYKLTDWSKIEKTLIHHIERCYRTKKWFPLIIYYILKQKDGTEVSQMVTDMGNINEENIVEKPKDFEI